MKELEYAKEHMALINGKSYEEDERRSNIATGYALIAIAEQLERIANPTPYQPQPLQVMSDEERKALEDK